jgi:macrodomain Ter protein organizer (MatP/YcbG family)
MLERPNRKARNPNRQKPTGSISVRWEIYDELDQLANQYNMSLGMTVEALLKEHQRAEECA